MIYTPEKYKIKDESMKPFICDQEIWDFINQTQSTPQKVEEIVKKSLQKKRLSLKETAVLINANDQESLKIIKEAAKELKSRIYGERIVLFAPLYIGNYCTNNCTYCGFKKDNKNVKRITLDEEKLIQEVTALEENGHKRLILVYGEHPKYTPEFISQTVRTVYKVKKNRGEIRRVNINAAPLSVKGFKTVLDAGIGTYQVFQETYHHESYKKFHPSGKKSNYDWRLTSLDRAQEAGIDDVGIGVLFGLYDWRFEVLALIRHINHFEAVYNVGPHTISFPRIQNASDMNINEKYFVNDDNFTKLVAILRLAVPYTGMILTAREPEHVRKEVMKYGVSQIDGGTNIELCGYTEEGEFQNIDNEQFTINDSRTLNEVIHELLENSYIPSFCTSCYRAGRTGEHFMEFSVPGFIKKYCNPNAILTLVEYLEDYAPEETKKLGYEVIEKKLKELEDSINVNTLRKHIEATKNGSRDLFY